MQDSNSFNHRLYFLLGAAFGASVMALMDPGRGARRRSLLRDKVQHGMNVAGRETWKQVRNLGANVKGAIAERRSAARDARVILDNEQLEDRVKAQIGHVLSHFSVEVRAHDGHVVVSGPVMRGERRKLEDRLRETRGVRGFELQVREHDSPAGVPGLQGVPKRPARENVA
ncbi:MAG TPA: BON domain-containing protein [Clostridia bacterium]|nr:BON domain-containing protein [Clostridia bacterium]